MDSVLAAAHSATELYTVDCGLGAQEFLTKGIKVTTIDHHIGAKEDFEELARRNPEYTFVFDNEKSGASLAWRYFFPKETEPKLIKYVEDADLWKWKYGEDTKDTNNYLSMFRNDPVRMLELIEGSLDEIKSRGNIISLYADREIERQITLPPVAIKIGKHTVPAYNITVYESASGNILSEREDKAVAMFTIMGGNVKLGFRSKEHQTPSALELAQALGGGGHKCASGADISLQKFLDMFA